MKRFVLVLTVTVAALSATAQESEFARVLIPVHTDELPGANGSLWYSDIWLHANTDQGAWILPQTVTDVGPYTHQTVRLSLYRAGAGQAPGQLILVTRAALDDVQFNLRVRDLSRQGETWGTEVPVVPEHKFLAKPVALLPVPLGSGFRSTVRVYGLEQTGGSVRVRVSSIANDEAGGRGVLYDAVWHLAPTVSQFTPPYAEIPIYVILPASPATARIDVEPVTPGFRFWALASVTHNETQHVTVISPQIP